MRPSWEEIVAFVAAFGATLFTSALGEFTPWLSTLFVVSFLDWVTGTAVGCQTRDWRASLNAAGIARKLAIFVVLTVCRQLDVATAAAGNPGLLQGAGTLWYLAHEILSMSQNLQKLNAPIFPGLGEAAAALLARTGGGPGATTAIAGGGDVMLIVCSRCGRQTQGLQAGALTAGFYDMSVQPWAKYSRGPREKYVCDACMHVDQHYLADFPPIPTR